MEPDLQKLLTVNILVSQLLRAAELTNLTCFVLLSAVTFDGLLNIFAMTRAYFHSNFCLKSI
jgi:hypothetical protein